MHDLGPDALVGVGSATVGAVTTWAILREKVRRLETDVRELRDEQKLYVTRDSLRDVLAPITAGIEKLEQTSQTILERLLDRA